MNRNDRPVQQMARLSGTKDLNSSHDSIPPIGWVELPHDAAAEQQTSLRLRPSLAKQQADMMTVTTATTASTGMSSESPCIGNARKGVQWKKTKAIALNVSNASKDIPDNMRREARKVLPTKGAKCGSPSVDSSDTKVESKALNTEKQNLKADRAHSPTLEKKLQEMESKIKKYAKTELEYLNKAKELRRKRKEWSKLAQVLRNPTDLSEVSERTANKIMRMSEADILKKITYLDAKVEKATSQETALLRESKKINGKRYRLTKVYECTVQDNGGAKALQREINLPPLLPPSSRTLIGFDATV